MRHYSCYYKNIHFRSSRYFKLGEEVYYKCDTLVLYLLKNYTLFRKTSNILNIIGRDIFSLFFFFSYKRSRTTSI